MDVAVDSRQTQIDFSLDAEDVDIGSFCDRHALQELDCAALRGRAQLLTAGLRL